MWKQEAGQWVERKEHSGWAKRRLQSPRQQQQQQQRRLEQSSRQWYNTATRVRFLPEGFKDKDDDVTALPPPVFQTAQRDEASKEMRPFCEEQQRWVTIYGVSPMSIMDVREYLDIMFGRTVDHYCPANVEAVRKSSVSALDRGQNWFYVKFEDPISAARAVCQAPLTVSFSAGCSAALSIGDSCVTRTNASAAHAYNTNGSGTMYLTREEVVGVAWCTDIAFLQKEAEREKIESRSTPQKKRTSGSPPKATDCSMNTSGIRSSVTDRVSRGFGTVLRDLLLSPWNGRWTATPSRPDSSPVTSQTHTEVFHEDCEKLVASKSDISVPSCLFLQGRPYAFHSAARRIDCAISPSPLPGNLSVLSAFCVDESQRHFLLQLARAVVFLPLRAFSFLMWMLTYDSEAEDVRKRERGEEGPWAEDRAVRESQWCSSFFGLNFGQRYQQQRRMLCQRHYNSAARMHLATGESDCTAGIIFWTPCRWYENSVFLSLVFLLCLAFLIYSFCGYVTSAVIDPIADASGGYDTTVLGTSLNNQRSNGKQEAPRVVMGQREGTVVKGDIYSSNIYAPQTL